jgi:hypothetical protein
MPEDFKPFSPLAPTEPATASKERAGEHEPAAEQLRAFEDKHLGPDVHRIHGKVESGHGAPRYGLHPDLQARHMKLEALVELEKKRDEAAAKLDSAEIEHENAEKRLTAAHEVLGKAEGDLVGVHTTKQVIAGEKWDGPTVEEFVERGYSAKNYPPPGYASRSTPEAIKAAVDKENEAIKKADDERKAREAELAKERQPEPITQG